MDINNIQSSAQNLTYGLSSAFLSDKKNADTSVVASTQFTQEIAQKSTEKETNVNSKENVDDMLNSLNDQLQTLQSFLKFEKDEDNQKMVFFIKNSETGETIRQIPSQELLTISKNIGNYLEAVQQSSDLSGKTPSPVGLITSQMA